MQSSTYIKKNIGFFRSDSIKWICCQFKRIQTMLDFFLLLFEKKPFRPNMIMIFQYDFLTKHIWSNYRKSVEVCLKFLSNFGSMDEKWIGLKNNNNLWYVLNFRMIPWKDQAWSRFCKMISSLKATCHPGSPLPV